MEIPSQYETPKKKEDRNKERNLECDIGSKERVSDTKQGPSNSQPVQKKQGLQDQMESHTNWILDVVFLETWTG